jgi:hypothetical protein
LRIWLSQFLILCTASKLIKIGAKMVSHGRRIIFQITEVVIPPQLFSGGYAAHRNTWAAPATHLSANGPSIEAIPK